MEEAEAEAAPWQTKSRWQSELAEICKSGDEERLRDLCGTFHLKRKHLEEPFARSFPEAIVLNSKLKGSQPRKVLLEQFTPLHLACWHDNRTIVEALIHADDPVDHFVFDSSGRTPFKVCVDAGATGALAEMESLIATSDMSSRVLFQPDASGQTPFHSAVENGYKTLPKVLYECGSNANRAATICVTQICDGNATSSRVVATPLHAACIYAGRGDPNYLILIERLLTVYNADRHAVVECGACSSDAICDCPYANLTARSILDVDDDFRADREDARALFLRMPAKRPKRPVKERAAKLGLELPPTPDGARAVVKSGSPESKKKARKVIQRHQQACHQKVQRAEDIAEHSPSVWGGKKRRDGVQLRYYFGI